MTQIAELRKQIIDCIAAGESTEKLEEELQVALEAERRDVELDRLRAIASRRQAYKDMVDKVVGKIKRTKKAISIFLKERDKLGKEVTALLEKAEALESIQADCFADYARDSFFRSETRHIPKNYLPVNLTCPMLGHRVYDGTEILAVLVKYLKLAKETLDQVEVYQVKPSPGDVEREEVEVER